MNQLVNINIHGEIWDKMPKKTWNLAVKSCSEAIHAINILTRNALFSNLLENDKKSIKYEILINKNPCLFAETPDINNLESLFNSELVIEYPNLKTIDIVPIVEGANADIGMIIGGIILIAAGMFIPGLQGPGLLIGLTMLKGALIFGGLGLIAAGIINLLSTPPKLEDFKGVSKRGSYLFDGPENVVGEGGPVPLVYGQLLVGSQTVASTYDISNQNAANLLTV